MSIGTSTQSAYITAGATSVSITKPTGTVAGNTMVLVMTWQSGSYAQVDPTTIKPSSWASGSVLLQTGGSPYGSAAPYYKSCVVVYTAGASEPASYTVNFPNAVNGGTATLTTLSSTSALMPLQTSAATNFVGANGQASYTNFSAVSGSATAIGPGGGLAYNTIPGALQFDYFVGAYNGTQPGYTIPQGLVSYMQVGYQTVAGFQAKSLTSTGRISATTANFSANIGTSSTITGGYTGTLIFLPLSTAPVAPTNIQMLGQDSSPAYSTAEQLGVSFYPQDVDYPSGETMPYVAIRRKLSADSSYTWWNGSAWVGTETWISNTAVTSPYSSGPTANSSGYGIYYTTLTTFAAGNWQLSAATQDSSGNKGSYCQDISFLVGTPGVITASAPSSQGSTNAVVSWSVTSGSVASYRIYLYDQVYASGNISTSFGTANASRSQSPYLVGNGGNYLYGGPITAGTGQGTFAYRPAAPQVVRAYVRTYDSNGVGSNWAYVDFTLTPGGQAAPGNVTVTPTADNQGYTLSLSAAPPASLLTGSTSTGVGGIGTWYTMSDSALHTYTPTSVADGASPTGGAIQWTIPVANFSQKYTDPSNASYTVVPGQTYTASLYMSMSSTASDGTNMLPGRFTLMASARGRDSSWRAAPMTLTDTGSSFSTYRLYSTTFTVPANATMTQGTIVMFIQGSNTNDGTETTGNITGRIAGITVTPGTITSDIQGVLNNLSVRVDRSVDGGSTWTSVRSSLGTTVTPGSTQNFTFTDYEYPMQTAPVYRACIASNAVAGVYQTLDGAYSTTDNSPAVLTVNDWWLKDPLQPSHNSVYSVATVALKKAESQTVHQPLGSSTAIVVSDYVVGPETGTLTIDVMPSEWAKLETLRNSQRTVLVQSPWGDQWYARFGPERSVVLKSAVSSTLMREVTLTFTEVAAP